MSDQNTTAAATESEKGKQTPAEDEDKALLASIYESMANDGDDSDQPEGPETPEAAVEAAGDDEKPAEKGKKDKKEEPEEKTEPDEPKKSTDEEIAEAMAAIETEKQAIAEQKRELVKSFGKLKSQEEKIGKKSKDLAQKEQAFQQKCEQREAEHRVWLEDVRNLMTGPVETKIQLLKKVAGELDIVDAVKVFNESTAGVGTAERMLQDKLDAIEKRLAQRDEDHKKQIEAEERARQEATERAQLEREIQDGDALVRNHIGQIVANASAFRLPAIAELAEVLGPAATAQYLYNIGEKMAARGHRIPYAEAGRRIALEVTDFLTTDAGKKWLDGLRQQRPSAPQTQTTVTGTRTETPGSSLSAAATSAPGPRRSDLPPTEDALTELKLMSPRDFALRHLPAGLVD